MQKERCCFLDQASFEQRHGSKFNLANYIHQNCFNMYLYLHRKQKKSNCSPKHKTKIFKISGVFSGVQQSVTETLWYIRYSDISLHFTVSNYATSYLPNSIMLVFGKWQQSFIYKYKCTPGLRCIYRKPTECY